MPCDFKFDDVWLIDATYYLIAEALRVCDIYLEEIATRFARVDSRGTPLSEWREHVQRSRIDIGTAVA